MTKNTSNEMPAAVARLFRIEGELQSITPHKSGHINQTYLSTWKKGAETKRYIHQRINGNVFKDIPAVMANISTVLAHLNGKPADGDHILSLVPARGGKLFVTDPEGEAWRTYVFIEGTKSVDICPDAAHAREAASILGRFQVKLLDLPRSALKETIPDFLSTPHRYRQLADAAKSDIVRRLSSCQAELAFARERAEFAETIAKGQSRGEIPFRPVHGDMKLNNILFSKKSGRALCIVDLDTCMPGYSLYDFGDLARSSAVLADEDEQDFAKVKLDLNLFSAVSGGYLEQMGKHLTPAEVSLIPLVPRLLALTLGVRFLTDYLNNDSYFRVADKEHNLRRTRSQFQLVKSMEAAEDEMRSVISANQKRWGL